MKKWFYRLSENYWRKAIAYEFVYRWEMASRDEDWQKANAYDEACSIALKLEHDDEEEQRTYFMFGEE